MTVRIGTAGWGIPSAERPAFPQAGSHLERYAAVFDAVEINSSFYRPHRRTTYERWAASVGDDFRFSVKLPRSISHAAAADFEHGDLARFADEIAGLGTKLGVVLVQFPPSLTFCADRAAALFEALTAHLHCPLACEPRHATWFAEAAELLLAGLRIARVGADPARAEGADVPAGWSKLCYHRLHGSPRTYYSKYEPAVLEALRSTIESEAGEAVVWCIFDNTASGAATSNALELKGFW